jgi:thioredoxin 1
MKKPSSNMITLSALLCSFVFMIAVNAQAGVGKDKVEAAKAKGMPVFVDFGKTSCAPCKMMVPVLETLTKKYKGKMEVVFVHVDEEKDYAHKMGVTMLPTQILLDKNGKEVSRHVGYIPVEDCEKIISKGGAVVQGKVCPPGKECPPGKACCK